MATFINMTATIENLQAEVEPYRGTLVLDHFDVVRLVDVIDGEDDFYWVYDTRRGIVHSTCVGMWIPLKGIIPDDQYKRLVITWNYNNSEPAV